MGYLHARIGSGRKLTVELALSAERVDLSREFLHLGSQCIELFVADLGPTRFSNGGQERFDERANGIVQSHPGAEACDGNQKENEDFIRHAVPPWIGRV